MLRERERRQMEKTEEEGEKLLESNLLKKNQEKFKSLHKDTNVLLVLQ